MHDTSNDNRFDTSHDRGMDDGLLKEKSEGELNEEKVQDFI